MLAIAFRYGLIASLIMAIWSAGLVGFAGAALKGHSIFSSEWMGYTIMIVSLSMIFLAVRDYRNKTLGGVIKFLPALGLGLLIAVMAGIAYAAAWEVYLYSSHYGFGEHYAAVIAEHARAAGKSAAQAAAEAEAFSANYANPLIRVPMTFLEIFPVGVIIALISAALLRNPKVLPARG